MPKLPRSELGFIALCAWNNIEPSKAPPEWRFAYNQSTLDAWARVFEAVRKEIEKEKTNG